MAYCIDAPACGCCDFNSDIASPELVAEIEAAWEVDAPCCDCDCDCSTGDCGCCDCSESHAAASVLADEDCRYQDDMLCEGYDEH